MLAGGAALGALLLTSCALPGTAAPVGNISTVHVAGVPAVVAPPVIAVTPSNASQGVGLDAPVIVTVNTGHLDTVSLSEAGSSTPSPGVMSPDGTSWQMDAGARPGGALHGGGHGNEHRGLDIHLNVELRDPHRQEPAADRDDPAGR